MTPADVKLLIKPIYMEPALVETFSSDAQDYKSHSVFAVGGVLFQIAFIMNTKSLPKL